MSGDRTVLLLVDHDQNRDLLVDHLGETHEVVTPAEDGSVPEFDLCLADRDGLAAHREAVSDRKHEAGSVFLPVLLLQDEQYAAQPDWELALVDDVETMPLASETLSDRVSDLLDRRELSTEVAAEKRRELREQEAFTEAALEALPDLFYVFDPDGSLQRWNARAPAVTGYAESELEEMHTLDFLPEPDRERVAAQIVQVLEDGGTRTLEVPLVTKDGEQIPYEFRVAPLYGLDDDVAGGVGVGRDITDREMRRELARQNERLEKFASIVSHDLRNPIAIASGYLDLARDDCESPHLAQVDDAIDRMEALTDDLLALARQGKVVDETERVALAEVATDAWEAIETAGATFDARTDHDVLADASRLRQLFENLFRNSVEHGGDVTVTVGDTNRGFYVADDGPGIPPADRERAFEYGFTTSDEGTGFGLAIVREIADAHGWSVELTESESGGVRFVFGGVEHPLPDD
jgi:PAS domain S-box-containing protein